MGTRMIFEITGPIYQSYPVLSHTQRLIDSLAQNKTVQWHHFEPFWLIFFKESSKLLVRTFIYLICLMGWKHLAKPVELGWIVYHKIFFKYILYCWWRANCVAHLTDIGTAVSCFANSSRKRHDFEMSLATECRDRGKGLLTDGFLGVGEIWIGCVICFFQVISRQKPTVVFFSNKRSSPEKNDFLLIPPFFFEGCYVP